MTLQEMPLFGGHSRGSASIPLGTGCSLTQAEQHFSRHLRKWRGQNLKRRKNGGPKNEDLLSLLFAPVKGRQAPEHPALGLSSTVLANPSDLDFGIDSWGVQSWYPFPLVAITQWNDLKYTSNVFQKWQDGWKDSTEYFRLLPITQFKRN